MDCLKMMRKAIDAINTLESESEFVLKDLFDGVKWKRLPKGERLHFGRYFKQEVLAGKVEKVLYMGKMPNNSAYYKKFDDR